MRLENEGLKTFQELAIPEKTRIVGWAAIAQALGFVPQGEGYDVVDKTRGDAGLKFLAVQPQQLRLSASRIANAAGPPGNSFRVANSPGATALHSPPKCPGRTFDGEPHSC